MNKGFENGAQAEACALLRGEGLRAVCEAHYRGQEREGGVESRCKMWLPAGLEGKRVLDVGCRRGKGAYKLAEAVGPEGFVLGVDWSPGYLDAARQGAVRAAEKAGLEAFPLEFALAFPECMAEAGVEAGSFDVVVANSVLNAALSIEKALCEASRALKPGGLLYFATLVAQEERDALERAQAAARGDVVGSALPWDGLERALAAAGFERASCEDDGPLEAEGKPVPGIRQAVVSAWVR